MSIVARDHVYDHLKQTSISADITKGTVALVQDCYVFYPQLVDVSVDSTGIPLYECKQALMDKKTGTGQDITAGDFLYGDPADSYKVSKTKGSGYVFLGIAKNNATSSDTNVLGHFIGWLSSIL